MAIIRAPKDYLSGILGQPAALTATSLNSASFANLPTNYSTSFVLPLTLHDPAQGIYEVVWVTAHAAGSQQVTVVRGKEGSQAQPWPQFTQVLAAPTAARDALAVITSSTRPADGHLGMRAVETDTNQVKELTSSGWLSGLYSDAAGLTPGHGSSVPSTAVPIIKAFTSSYTADGSGNGVVAFPGAAFPNGVISCLALANNTGQSVVSFKLVSGSVTKTSVTLAGFQKDGTAATGACSFDMIAIGY